MDKKPEISYVFIRWIFLRFLSVIYLVAFVSFLIEAKGLYGESGIISINSQLSTLYANPAITDFFQLPSLFLFWHDDTALLAIPLIGIVFALLSILGIFTGPALFLCWIMYLSIINVGDIFMSFQWDILLMEVGFLAIFLASWKPLDFNFSWIVSNKSRLFPFINTGRPSIVIIWLYRWLLFRLMFASGIVKLRSGDQNWHNLTAMQYHYETQPLPTPIGWFLHQFPDWFQQLSTAGMFFIELLVPILFFAPRKIRYVAGAIQIFLQILILLTGNYCFFNLLTIALCLFLFDDSLVNKVTKSKFEKHLTEFSENFKPSKLRYLYLVPLTSIVILISLFMFPPGNRSNYPSALLPIIKAVYPFHLVNSYGLFAVMTTSRPEIIVEGSMDGKTWKAYEFKYKAGRLNRAPCVIEPFQPRLDWQMWFASLGNVYQNQWFVAFCQKLLEGSKDVTTLLEKNPFPEKPPKYVRARVFSYEMTDFGELTKTGNWWRRTYEREYMPPVSLISK